jgi:hypothetical protein
MLSYHSDPDIKSKYLARLEGHAAADEIIKGQYWEAGKGCAVGCTVHGASHDDYERELGIPRMLAWLEDVIFEGLPNRTAKTWPQQFLSSIEPGKDLSRVGWQFLHWILTERGSGEFGHPLVRNAVKQCAAVLVPLASGRVADKAAADDAAGMAWTAARQAEFTAGVPAGAAWIAESAARAAESAALRLSSPDLSAERAATAVSAAISRSAEYIVLSEKLLALLRAA